MAEVTWINGSLNPPKSGEYYIIIEAQEDTQYFKRGDIEITDDWFNACKGTFDTIGENNHTWKVLNWAYILHPNIPNDLRDRVRLYFGVEVGVNDD